MLSWYPHEIATWKHDLYCGNSVQLGVLSQHCTWATFCALLGTHALHTRRTLSTMPRYDPGRSMDNTVCDPIVCFFFFFIIMRPRVLNSMHASPRSLYKILVSRLDDRATRCTLSCEIWIYFASTTTQYQRCHRVSESNIVKNIFSTQHQKGAGANHIIALPRSLHL